MLCVKAQGRMIQPEINEIKLTVTKSSSYSKGSIPQCEDGSAKQPICRHYFGTAVSKAT